MNLEQAIRVRELVEKFDRLDTEIKKVFHIKDETSWRFDCDPNNSRCSVIKVSIFDHEIYIPKHKVVELLQLLLDRLEDQKKGTMKEMGNV